MTSVQQIPVLVVGGGLVGLSAALFLEYHDIPYVLVERRAGASVLPRSRGMHVRTAELYRQIGIEEPVQRAASTALRAGGFGGAWEGDSLRTATALELPPSMLAMMKGDPSPARFLFLPQVLLEPVLADLARERGGDLRFGVELVDFDGDAAGVTATLRDESGSVTRVRADYLIAADGAGSPIRRALGIPGAELPPTHHYLNAFCRVDLTGVLGGRSFSQCEIVNDRVRGLVLTKNNTDEWSFHIEYDPAAESPRDYPDERCVDLIRAMIGEHDIPVEVLARSAWDTGTFVADEYRRDRIFLAGDAAHRHAPWGGFGGNTGIADVHNLAWKLAAVLAGTAGPALLDTYAAERRARATVAVEQSRLGADFRTRYRIATGDNADDLARQLDPGAVMTRFRYASNAVCGTATGRPHVDRLAGQPGTRLPHLWIDAAESVSTLDLCGPGFALLVVGTSAAWRDAAARALRDTGIEIAVHALPAEPWGIATWLPEGGALLVRPDMHVAARSDTGLTPATLTATLRSITGREARSSRHAS
ncbi:2-polyprenyl-6-methoxyphenol hydroxylase-like FAD-dependent oxidoreductase [Nocardia transvalensis]|uniref:2-polyprenyl-6-methoxyphenol hydroxylase-like FAD-dependent oxidoreductase n=1 Tax=Nocardia transvalensis TaxID=37333 RepID=A0A7W9UHX6_9NOCA|nr:FAD-dependent monooxygenase [Nocardia transvalensis]MBB5913834.1 2-polyprenyl-6-methoxyphenol hydroxylase-like FAD-dependent oxidoreductase [Nocardia transvalensis]